MEFSFKDTLRAIVETESNGKNTIMYDDYGNPNVMVRIPRFSIRSDWGVDGLPECRPHPAFIVHGKEISEFYISKYPCTRAGAGNTYSSFADALPDDNHGSWREAYDRCRRKGKGWHMLTNLEHVAISLLTAIRETKHYKFANHSETLATPSLCGSSGKVPKLTAVLNDVFYHDRTRHGISLFGGCLWDAVSGIKTIDGRLYVHGEDGIPMNNYDAIDEVGKAGNGWLDTKTYINVTNGALTYGTTNTTTGTTTDAHNWAGRVITDFDKVGGQNTVPSYFTTMGLKYTSLTGHEDGSGGGRVGSLQYTPYKGDVHVNRGGSYGSKFDAVKKINESSLFTTSITTTDSVTESLSAGVRVVYIPHFN